MSLGGLFERKHVGSILFELGLGLLLASCTLDPAIFHTGTSAQLASVSPVIESITPSAASTFGGAVVTVTGSGFQSSSTVAFSDGVPCSTTSVLGPTELTCTLPPHASGSPLLVVSTPGATNSSGTPFTFQSDLFTEISFLSGSYTMSGTYSPGAGPVARIANVGQFTSDGTYLYAAMGTQPVTTAYAPTLIARVHLGTGELSTLVSDPLDSGGTGDGPFPTAQFLGVTGLTMIGRVMYAADLGADTLRKIDLNAQMVSTIAGQAQTPGTTDGDGVTQALFTQLGDITTDGSVVYMIDNCTIRKYDPSTLKVTTISGSPGSCSIVDGTPPTARFANPRGIAYAAGMLYVSEAFCVREINPTTGEVGTIAGSCELISPNEVDGIGPSAAFVQLEDMTTDGTYLYVTDVPFVNDPASNPPGVNPAHLVHKINIATTSVVTIAGNPEVAVPGTNDGPLTTALLSYPYRIQYDPVHGLVVSSSSDSQFFDPSAIRLIH